MRKRRPTSGRKDESPARQLAGFIAKFSPNVAKLARAARALLRKQFPTAIELVYDGYNALAIGFSPTERTSDTIVSLAVYARGVNLYFIYGAFLPDPTGLLQGSGSQGRFIRLEKSAMIRSKPIQALIGAAIHRSKWPMPASGRGQVVVRWVSPKQQPRRPGRAAR